MDNDRQYDVGYGKPPKAFQFKKGKSGNPRGRPRKDPSIGEVIRRITKQKVRTNSENGQQSMTKLEASVTQLINKAATGDLRAMKLFFQMASQYPELFTGPETHPGITVTFVNPDGTGFDPAKR